MEVPKNVKLSYSRLKGEDKRRRPCYHIFRKRREETDYGMG